MTPPDKNNSQKLKFTVESLNKECSLRVKWNIKYAGKLYGAIAKESKLYHETDVLAATMIQGMAVTTREHISSALYKRTVPLRDNKPLPGVKDIKHGHSIVDVGLGNPKEDPRLQRPDTDLSFDPVMRPVDPKQKKIIYTSGKDMYLEKRYELPPCEKYYFPECSSWDYGWKAWSRKTPGPRYGVYHHLMRLLKSNRIGPQPDPPHYEQPQNYNEN